MEELIQKRVEAFETPSFRVGATYREGEGTYIRLWAPKIDKVEIEWENQEKVSLEKDKDGYFAKLFPSKGPGDKYYFHCDGRTRPDPASRFQPQGVFGASEVVSESFDWTDKDWQSIPFKEWIIYEIHPGTFSSKQNFDGIIDDLPRLKALGITTLEIMPVSQFSGTRNWGYDGVFPHAVHDSYGGPKGLKTLINAAHKHGLAVILDVVYNHLGPEGNILPSLAPYTQNKYHTPWGDALNYDGEYSEEVRHYFLQTVWQWLTEYHLDGLRLDAIQTIFDTSPVSFLQEVTSLKIEAKKKTGRELVLIAETDMNDSRMLDPVSKNGMGFDGHWADDLHHALHAELTGEKTGYYEDYGGVEQIAKIYKNGVAFENEYSPFRKRRHGKSYAHIEKHRLIVEAQNHDQIGNRLLGDRLTTMVNFEKVKLAAACIFLSPFTPFLFMGEEFLSEKPFQYFISHSDPKLVEAVRKGRREEWVSFSWKQEPPDPAAEETFRNCILQERDENSKSAVTELYYKDLIKLSKEVRRMKLDVTSSGHYIILDYTNDDKSIRAILSFEEEAFEYDAAGWKSVLKSDLYLHGYSGQLTKADKLKIAPFSATVLEK